MTLNSFVSKLRIVGGETEKCQNSARRVMELISDLYEEEDSTNSVDKQQIRDFKN